MDFTVSISEARRLLGRPVLFAAGDDSRPVLTGVQVEVKAEGKVIATAADGFRLGTQILRHVTVVADGSAILPAASVQQAVKSWPRNAEGYVRIHTTDDGAFSITASVTEPRFGSARALDVRGDVIQGTFPDYRKLFEADSRDGGEYVALNAEYMATFEKVAKLDSECHGVTRIYMGAPSQPVTFQINDSEGGGAFIGMVMPMFVTWDAGETREALLAEIGVTPKKPKASRGKPAAAKARTASPKRRTKKAA